MELSGRRRSIRWPATRSRWSPARAATCARRPRPRCAGLSAELGFGYVELDVDADPALRAEYSDRVPVILIDGREHGYWRVEEARGSARAIAR